MILYYMTGSLNHWCYSGPTRLQLLVDLHREFERPLNVAYLDWDII